MFDDLLGLTMSYSKLVEEAWKKLNAAIDEEIVERGQRSKMGMYDDAALVDMKAVLGDEKEMREI